MGPASAFRFSPSIVVVLDVADGSIADINPAGERLLGYVREDVIGKRPVDLGLWPDLATRTMIWTRLRSEQRVCGEQVPFRTSDGTLMTGRIHCEMFEEAGKAYVLSIVQDAAPDAQGHPASTAPIESYRSLFDAAIEGIYRSLPGGGFIDVNLALARMLGYETQAELMMMAPRQTRQLYVDDEHATQLLDQLERQGQIEDVQSRIYKRDGSIIWISENARAVCDAAGHLVFYEGTVVDITARIEAEARLKQSEQKYRALFQDSVTGMFQSHPDGRLLEANDSLARILGYPDAEQLKAGVPNMSGLYANPDERAQMIAELLSRGRIQNWLFSARRRTGTTALVELNAHVVRDANGNVLYIEGSAHDITARKAAERALAQSEARFRAIVEHSQVGVYVMRDDRYTYVNKAFARIVGYLEQELLGMSFVDLLAPDAMADVAERHRRRAAGDPQSDAAYETSIRRKDNSIVDIMANTGYLTIDGVQHHAGTIIDITAQRRFERTLEHNATHDALTGLPNRLFFERELARVIADSAVTGAHDYAVLLLDLDGFKLVNDSLGHASGDRLLVQIADTLRANLGGQMLVARYGGDEFTLLSHGSCPRARAIQLAERVLGLLRDSFDINGHAVYSGASLGVVLGNTAYETPDQVLRDADIAMYRAKAGGKSAHVIFDDAMHAAARARLKLETDLRMAFERREFRVFFQPIVSLRDASVLGFESLVRWQHPDRGLLLPADFLGTADETGLIVALDWWVLEQTCKQLSRWQRQFPQHAQLRANINIDERQFADRDIVGTLHTILKRTGVHPSSLALEITETVFRRGRTGAESTLRALKEFGVSLVVDDFGTGYSSFDSFVTSPFDALKIDYTFVRDMVSNYRHRAIVRTIAAFAQDLGLRLTAEGVESRDQAELLAGLNCVGAQGFLYAKPLPAEEMECILGDGLTLVRHG